MSNPLNTPLYEMAESDLEAKLPEIPLTSRNAIMAYYGALEVAAAGLDPSSDEAFLTPKRLAQLDSEEWIVLSLDLDLTNLEAPEYLGVSSRSLSEPLQTRLGLSRYSAGKRDHSVTNVGKKSTTELETAGEYLYERVDRWPDREPVADVASEHPDGVLIEKLSKVAEQTTADDVTDELGQIYGGDQQVVTTVRVQLDPDAFEQPPTSEADDNWYYPGEVPVLIAAAAQRNRSKLAEKNIDSGDSRGDAVCSVGNDETEVIGAVGDPLELYALQHSDEFWKFDVNQSWRHNPVAPRNGPLISRADSFLENCYSNASGLRVYALPYFAGKQTYQSAVLTHEILRRIQQADWDETDDADSQVTRIQLFVNDRFEDLADRLRFYFITLRTDSSGVRVFYEEPSVSALPVLDVAEEFAEVRDGILGAHSGFTYNDGWELLTETSTPRRIADYVLSRGYARETLLEPYPKASDYKDAASDPREELTYAILTGGTVDPEWLLEQYLRRLNYERRENDMEVQKRQQKLKQQFVQFQSLAAVGALSSRPASPHLAAAPTTMADQTQSTVAVSTDGGSTEGYVETLNRQLDEFIENHPALSEHPERRGAFLAGVFVSIVSKHQREERGLSRTFMDRYDMSDITPSQLMQFIPEVLSKDQIYARDHKELNSTVAPGIRQRLPEHLASEAPTDWSITPVQFRYFYSLGTAYGEDASYAARAAMNAETSE